MTVTAKPSTGGRGHRATPEQIASPRNRQIARTYKTEGLSLRATGALYGITYARVQQILIRLGVARRPRKAPVDRLRLTRAVKLFVRGASAFAAARQAGVGYTSLKLELHRLGVYAPERRWKRGHAAAGVSA